MRPYKHTKRRERPLMQQLAEKRERMTPEHRDPEWVKLFWMARRMLT